MLLGELNQGEFTKSNKNKKDGAYKFGKILKALM